MRPTSSSLSSTVESFSGPKPPQTTVAPPSVSRQAPLREVCKHLGKSRSAASAVGIIPPVASRRNDSFLEQHDGIQSAILHCKRSYNSSRSRGFSIVGMICCEEEGRLKEKHVFLQSSLIIAAGPFTTTDNLFFEPLTELLAYAQRKQPQLLLLLGPFIDSAHPDIKKGAVNRTFDEMFRLEILGRLQDYVEYMGSAARVILVPSIRDANHDFVFPQPAFDIQQADLKHQIKVGCCTVDILKQLSGEEISRNPSGGSNFCPLYPPMEDTPVDFPLAPEALQIPCNLDILILSSDLAHFVKVLSIGDKNDGEEQAKCICVNPGRLARGEGAGFFVELNYGGSPDSTSASVISIWTLNYRV
ncbi:unnamed protein product [Camellia sinensis]